MNLRHQSSAMSVIMLGEKTHTRGLQRKEETPYQPLSQQIGSYKKTTNNLLISATITVDRQKQKRENNTTQADHRVAKNKVSPNKQYYMY